jgi:hypothetical protein
MESSMKIKIFPEKKLAAKEQRNIVAVYLGKKGPEIRGRGSVRRHQKLKCKNTAKNAKLRSKRTRKMQKMCKKVKKDT